MKIFCAIYDTKLEHYIAPIFFSTKGEALRGFIDVVNNKSTQIGQHPEDFTLFYLGDWNEETGEMKNLKTPVSIGLGLELCAKSENLTAKKVDDRQIDMEEK